MLSSSSFLKGEKIYLNSLALTDVPALMEWQGNEHVMRSFDALPMKFKGVIEWEDWIKETGSDKFRFAIRSIDKKQLIGYAELEGILWNHRVGWISIMIGDETNHGKGFGKEAMEKVIYYAFNELNLHRLQLTVFAYNHKAIAMYERLGFQKEGTYREFLERDGKRHDMFLYGLLRNEWRKQNSK